MLTKIATDLDFVIAKTRAMHSLLYEGDRLSGLLRHRRLPELAQELFPMDTFASHTALERRLVERFAESLAQMWRFFKSPRDRLFTVLAVRLQIENLKVVLRSHLSGRRVPADALPIIPLPEPFAWPGFDLAKLQNVQDILNAIPEPILRESAGDALLLFSDNPVPLYLEAGLDAGYLQLLVQAWRRLGAEDRAAVRPMVAMEIDLHNLMFTLRARANYRLEPDLVVRLAAHQIDHMGPAPWVAAAAQGQSVRDVLARAPRSLRHALADVPAEPHDIERALWCAYYARANRIYFRTFFSLGCPYAFAAVKRMELANLITVVEAVRYGLSIEDTLNRFLRPAA